MARRRRIEVVLVKHDTPGDRADEVTNAAALAGVPVRMVDGRELDALVNGKSHGGVVAVCHPRSRWDRAELFDFLKGTPKPLLLLLEGIDDARNLGFVCRTAEALGAHALMIKKHLWDFDEPSVARSSSGAYERLPLVQFDEIDLLVALQKQGLTLIGCLAGAKKTLYDVKLAAPVIIALGGEKRGLSGAVRGICDVFATIPTVGGASSLSLSHASAIALAEAFRQRQPDRPAVSSV